MHITNLLHSPCDSYGINMTQICAYEKKPERAWTFEKIVEKTYMHGGIRRDIISHFIFAACTRHYFLSGAPSDAGALLVPPPFPFSPLALSSPAASWSGPLLVCDSSPIATLLLLSFYFSLLPLIAPLFLCPASPRSSPATSLNWLTEQVETKVRCLHLYYNPLFPCLVLMHRIRATLAAARFHLFCAPQLLFDVPFLTFIAPAFVSPLSSACPFHCFHSGPSASATSVTLPPFWLIRLG